MSAATTPARRIFATVGTDHHPFDRLMGWLDEFLAASPRVSCFVQKGTSTPPVACAHRDYLTYPEMEAAFREADAVVTHGGPGTIMLVLATGKKPIVVPRRQDLGEHVDDHQRRFAGRLSKQGTIAVAETWDDFAELLGRALQLPQTFTVEPSASGAGAAARFGELVDELVASRKRGSSARVDYK